MVELNEVVILVIFSLGYIPILISYIKDKTLLLLFMAYNALVIGAIATIIEEFFYPTFLNYVEHVVGIMGSGFLFFVYAFLSYRKSLGPSLKSVSVAEKRSRK